MARVEEVAWIPMCVPKNGRPFFFDRCIRDLRRDALADFAKYCCVEWQELRKEGWRIVRVRLTTELHQ